MQLSKRGSSGPVCTKAEELQAFLSQAGLLLGRAGEGVKLDIPRKAPLGSHIS